MSVLEDRSALEAIPNKIAWEDAEQGPGMVMSTLASEKNRKLLFIDNVFTNSDISRCCFTKVQTLTTRD